MSKGHDNWTREGAAGNHYVVIDQFTGEIRADAGSEEGNVADGLDTFSQALALAERLGDDERARALRVNLAAWATQVTRQGVASPGEAKGIQALTFAADGKSVFMAADTYVRRWDVATGREAGPPIRTYRHANRVAYLDADTLMTFAQSLMVSAATY